MIFYVEVNDIKNRIAKVRIAPQEDWTVPVWKAYTVGRFKVALGPTEDTKDGMLLYHLDARMNYRQINVVLLHDFWDTKNLKMNDLGNAFIYDEGVTNFEGGVGMWKQVSG